MNTQKLIIAVCLITVVTISVMQISALVSAFGWWLLVQVVVSSACGWLIGDTAIKLAKQAQEAEDK